MSAARRRTGTKMVIASAVLIVVTFVAVVVSVWLSWQLSAVTGAIDENQRHFKDTVGVVFREHGWDMPSVPSARYGLIYQREAYGAVVTQLKKAAEHDELMPLLGWESIVSIKGKLTSEGSPVQGDVAEPYNTLEGLLSKYESEYTKLTAEVATLKGDLEQANKLVNEKTEAAAAERDRLTAEYTEAVARHREDMEESTKQFENMRDMYNQARDEVKQLEDKLLAAASDWEAEKQKLLAEVAKWRTLYGGTMPREKVEAMKAEGKVLEVDASYGFVVLEGGKDMQRERNTGIVVYSESLSGVRNRKGEVRITNVFENTSLATIIGQRERLLAGDLYVTEAVWDKFAAVKKEEALPVPAVPAVEKPAPEVKEAVGGKEEAVTVTKPEEEKVGITAEEKEEVEVPAEAEEKVEAPAEEKGAVTEEEAIEFFK